MCRQSGLRLPTAALGLQAGIHPTGAAAWRMTTITMTIMCMDTARAGALGRTGTMATPIPTSMRVRRGLDLPWW